MWRSERVEVASEASTRTAKHLVFDPPEDVTLVSAWLIHLNGPINGNYKKNESYWGDVYAHYNRTTATNRKREVKHLKDCRQKIKRWLAFFCACWKKVTSIYLSGYSDDRLKDMAKQFYLDDYPKEGPLTVEHCWKILCDEPKWHAILEELENPIKGVWMMKMMVWLRNRSDKILMYYPFYCATLKNRYFIDEIFRERISQELVPRTGIYHTTDKSDRTNVEEKERPIRTKRAKKQRNSKGRVRDDDVGLDEDLKKFIDFLEAREHISDKKFEIARLRRETALLESYEKLLCMDTREMTEEIRVEHVLAMKMLREKLAGNSN
ncbi:hypothetical protein SORBI_3001G311866 [Sorghum bicolor]|uniref:No apical meristem-associated C-terminal domain-containing protein n=1 Tax=Sorghum bicolor TaxID=4558 RepID=A0A1Z5S8H5_SORBI|nr:hypothetical protein SORBI_3001G311866 [Sorghum bicolor]